MAKLLGIASDPALEVDGVRWECGGGLVATVARMWNPEFDDEVARLRDEYVQEHGPEVPDDAREDIMLRASAKCVLKNLESVDGTPLEDEDGAPIEGGYTPELGERMFRDPRYREFYRGVQTVSNQAHRYRAQAAEAAAGN